MTTRVATRTRIGDPLPLDVTIGGGSSLRPDGMAVAIGGGSGNGVAIWDLNPHHLAAACRLAGRNLTHTEWDSLLGAVGDYRPNMRGNTADPSANRRPVRARTSTRRHSDQPIYETVERRVASARDARNHVRHIARLNYCTTSAGLCRLAELATARRRSRMPRPPPRRAEHPEAPSPRAQRATGSGQRVRISQHTGPMGPMPPAR